MHWGKKIKLYTNNEYPPAGAGFGLLLMGQTAPGDGGSRIVPMQVNSNGVVATAGVSSGTTNIKDSTGQNITSVAASGALKTTIYNSAGVEIDVATATNQATANGYLANISINSEFLSDINTTLDNIDERLDSITGILNDVKYQTNPGVRIFAGNSPYTFTRADDGGATYAVGKVIQGNGIIAPTPAIVAQTTFGGGGFIKSVKITTHRSDFDGGTMRVHFWNDNDAAFADNVAFTYEWATSAAYMGYVDVSPEDIAHDPAWNSQGGTMSYVANNDCKLAYNLADPFTTLYFIIEARTECECDPEQEFAVSIWSNNV